MKCKDFCKQRVAATLKKNRDNNPIPSKSKMKEKLKQSLKKCKTEEEREKVKREHEFNMKSIPLFKEMFKKLNDKKILTSACEKQYCNEGCKQTVYEDEPGKGFKEHIKKTMPRAYNSHMNTRKRIFEGKKSVLKDNFYEKLDDKKIKQIKKEGAISGCTNKISENIFGDVCPIQ